MNTSREEIEKVRKFWDSRPCNIRHSKSEFGTVKYFQEVEERRYYVEPHIRQFCEFDRWENLKVLEIGCGIGTDGVNFARAGALYTGIELSTESLQICQDRFKLLGLNGEFIEGDAETADQVLAGRTFDLIYSFGVIHHTPSIENALQAMRNLSEVGTQIKVMVYASNSYKQALINAGLEQPEAQAGCPIANSYSKEEAIKLFSNAGFRSIEVTQDHIFPYSIEEYKEYKYVKEPWFNAMPDEVFQAMKKNFGWHLLINSEVSN